MSDIKGCFIYVFEGNKCLAEVHRLIANETSNLFFLCIPVYLCGKVFLTATYLMGAL